MKTKDRLTEVYFQNHSQPNEEEFIDLAQEQMFLAYLSKTLQETRKKYMLHSAQQTQAEIATDFQDTGMGSGLEDVYDYYFDDIISNLTERQKQYLKLSFQEGYSDRQIASCMGIKPQSVHDIKCAALERLRKELIHDDRK